MASVVTADEIERLSRRRQEIWAGAAEEHAEEVKQISNKLADLYELRRMEEAQERSGDRSTIVRRAKVETELGRLF